MLVSHREGRGRQEKGLKMSGVRYPSTVQRRRRRRVQCGFCSIAGTHIKVDEKKRKKKEEESSF